MEEKFKVSICMITYNHEKFIAQAIDGIMMQQTNFHFDLIIGEDCSTDNTRLICLEYQKKFPNNIKLFLPEKNLGGDLNFIQNLENCCNGYSFTAMCEGDDYWIDPNKLQLQVDFLLQNHSIGLVYTDVNIFNEETQTLEKPVPRFVLDNDDVIKELIISKYIEFPSVLVRTNLLRKLIDERFKIDFLGSIILDTRLILEFAQHSEIGYLPIVTTVYRHVQGSASRPKNIKKFLIASKDSYQLRKNFVLRYNYSAEILSIPVNNFNRGIINMASIQTNFFKALICIFNIKIKDTILYSSFANFNKKIDLKMKLKFLLTLLGVMALKNSIRKYFFM